MEAKSRADIVDFLCRAKKSTYAGKGAEVPSSRTASHDLAHEEGVLAYYDTYLGGEKFSGQEALWLAGKPIWSMNYCGRVLDQKFSGDFLKEVLSLVSPDSPYRGPLSYQKGDLAYQCAVQGDFDWFDGREEISCLGQKVYECVFHGGQVQ